MLPASGHVLPLAWKKSPPNGDILQDYHHFCSNVPGPLQSELIKTTKPYIIILVQCLSRPLTLTQSSYHSAQYLLSGKNIPNNILRKTIEQMSVSIF